jgi:hypothetical protein
MSNINIERELTTKNLFVKPTVKDSNIRIANNVQFDNLDSNYDIPNDHNIGLNFLTNNEKKIEEIQESDESEEDDQVSEDPFMGPNYEEEGEDSRYSGMSPEELLQKKAFFLSQLKRLEKKGHVLSRRLGPEHSIEEIEGEVIRIKKEIEIDNGVNYCKQGLVFFASTIEMVNTKVNFGEMDGFSIHVMSTQDQYDEVFEELYEKYASKINAGPEIKFITMFAASAFMFHLQKTMAKNAANSTKDGIMGSINNMMNKPKIDMKGPSKSADDILRNLTGDDSDMSDTMSDVSSQYSDLPEASPVRITVPVKKRGRPKKQN